MSFQNARRPYFPSDIEPVIAVAEAARWERDNDIQPRPVLAVTNRMAEARRLRSAYQRELVIRFAEAIGAWFSSSRTLDAPAKLHSGARR
jgi:hypothetical protein